MFSIDLKLLSGFSFLVRLLVKFPHCEVSNIDFGTLVVSLLRHPAISKYVTKIVINRKGSLSAFRPKEMASDVAEIGRLIHLQPVGIIGPKGALML